jgi:hypothetical protein
MLASAIEDTEVGKGMQVKTKIKAKAFVKAKTIESSYRGLSIVQAACAEALEKINLKITRFARATDDVGSLLPFYYIDMDYIDHKAGVNAQYLFMHLEPKTSAGSVVNIKFGKDALLDWSLCPKCQRSTHFDMCICGKSQGAKREYEPKADTRKNALNKYAKM